MADLISSGRGSYPFSTMRQGPLNHVVHATKHALKMIAIRARSLIAEAHELQRQLDALVHQIAPATSNVFALWPDTAVTLLIANGDNPERLRSEAALAPMCRAASISWGVNRCTHR